MKILFQNCITFFSAICDLILAELAGVFTFWNLAAKILVGKISALCAKCIASTSKPD